MQLLSLLPRMLCSSSWSTIEGFVAFPVHDIQALANTWCEARNVCCFKVQFCIEFFLLSSPPPTRDRLYLPLELQVGWWAFKPPLLWEMWGCVTSTRYITVKRVRGRSWLLWGVTVRAAPELRTLCFSFTRVLWCAEVNVGSVYFCLQSCTLNGIKYCTVINCFALMHPPTLLWDCEAHC